MEVHSVLPFVSLVHLFALNGIKYSQCSVPQNTSANFGFQKRQAEQRVWFLESVVSCMCAHLKVCHLVLPPCTSYKICNPIHIDLGVNPIELHGTYFWVNMHQLVLKVQRAGVALRHIVQGKYSLQQGL